jgi:bla regulator protein blaR1
MITGLVAHLWQCTFFAGAAWLTTLMLRKNRAQYRYWIWLTASAKFLIPFLLLVRLGTLMPRHAPAAPIRTEWVATLQQLGELPASDLASDIAITTGPTGHAYLLVIVAGLWAGGFAAVATCWLIRWARLQKILKSARAVSVPTSLQVPVPVMATTGLIEPGILGVFRPVLLLPEGIRHRLTQTQLDAILAHEFSHVRRKDNLTATIHMAAQAIFWFHPLTWWIGARLVDERERACDEDVLRLGCSPSDYAEGILNVCRHYIESPQLCVAGVTGSNLRERIKAIMSHRIASNLTLPRKVALAALGVIAVAMPVLIGVINTPAIRAQSEALSTARFEVASIKACASEASDRQGGTGNPSPGTLDVNCWTVKTLVQFAYLEFAGGRYNPAARSEPILGGPAWLESGRYSIRAKAAKPEGREMVEGPMLQALLEDRFKLQAHREVREVRVFELTVAKGGPKLKPFDGSCTSPADFTKLPQIPAPAKTPGDCRNSSQLSGTIWSRHWRGISIDSLILGILSVNTVGRPVVNKTGIIGLFDIDLEFTPENKLNADGAGPSIFEALQQQLGLRLVPAKGSGESLIIDHVERPSEN